MCEENSDIPRARFADFKRIDAEECIDRIGCGGNGGAVDRVGPDFRECVRPLDSIPPYISFQA